MNEQLQSYHDRFLAARESIREVGESLTEEIADKRPAEGARPVPR